MSADTPIEIDCQSVKQLLDTGETLLLVDCREQDEHAVAHIAAAKLVPMSEITQRVGELESHMDGRVVVHCHHGGRSLRVANWLRQNGFPQAQSMAGGIDQWALEIEPGMARY